MRPQDEWWKMTKEELNALGLDWVPELLRGEGEFLAGALRLGLKTDAADAKRISADYARISILAGKLRDKAFWSKLSYLLEALNLPPKLKKSTFLGITELFELKCFVYYYQQLRELAQALPYSLPDLEAVFQMLDPEASGQPGFRLSPAFSPALQEASRKLEELGLKYKKIRAEDLQKASVQLQEAGYQPLKNTEFILSRSQTALIALVESSGSFLRSSENVANLSYRLANSAAAEKIMLEMSQIRSTQHEAEDEVLENLNASLKNHVSRLNQALAQSLELGWDFLRARFANCYGCCIPKLSKRGRIALKGLRNLKQENLLKESGQSYQKQDLLFSNRINLITGPNMGGKTVLLQALGQCARLMHWAIPLPAEEAELPLWDFVYYNHDSPRDNLSSFGREIVSLHRALAKGTGGLFLLDEFAKGTNPAEAEALSSAVLLHLLERGSTCVAATHFSAPAHLEGVDQFMMAGLDAAMLKSLSKMADLSKRLKVLSEAMDYRLIKLKKGQNPARAALEIARALGLDEEILKLAEKK